MDRKIHCPRCRKETVYSPQNIYRPFCSERCKTIDLGAWAEEAYKVPSEEKLPEDEGFSENLGDSEEL